jgi:hypothetical protein
VIGLHRPRLTLGLTALVAGAALMVAALCADELTTAGFIDPGSPSARTLDRLRESLGYDPEPGMIVLARSPSGFDDSAEDRAQLSHLAARIRADSAVGRVQSGLGTRAPAGLTSSSGTETLLLIHFQAEVS